MISANCFLLTFLSILRLLYYTKAGQYLATSINECVETLRDIQMTKFRDANYYSIGIIRQDLKVIAVSPITPCATFSLSNSTLVGTFATILTYLIVLIQFKASENQDNDKILRDLMEIKEMLRMINNTSNSVT